MERENVRVRAPGAAPDISRDPRAANIIALARLMDSAFELPGTGVRIGIDPLLGLVPVVGDVLTTAVSLYIVLLAYRMGATRAQLAGMLFNIAIDFAVGEVPVLGDFFDFAFKANERNLVILGLAPSPAPRATRG